MSKPTKPATKETQDRIELEVPSVEPDAKPPSSQSKIDEFVKRRDEVAARDHDEFQDYLRLKEEEQARKGDELVPAAADYTPAGNIVREVVDTASDIRGRSLGNWVALLPTKMGGGTYAIDLHSNRVLGSIWYWNYGDYNPISHHLCAFPSADPKHGFEFVNSTQGGQNSLIYGMPTAVTAETAPPGTNIYRVRFDGTQMQLVENVSETTGLGLGVHVTVNPKDTQSYFVTDGQKDIAACFDRTTSKVKAALKFRLGSQCAAIARGVDQGWHAHHQQDPVRSQYRQVRLSRHQG